MGPSSIDEAQPAEMTTRFVLLFMFTTVVAACAGGAPPVVAAPVEPAGGPDGAPPSAPADASPSPQAMRAPENEAAAPMEAVDSAAVQVASGSTSACNEQSAQDFLVRGQFLKAGPDGNARAIQYRTEEYGYFKGFGHPGPGALPPSAFIEDTVFMGLHVKMHRKVIPALACVEEEIARSCADHPYQPHALAGIRYKNTYRGGEVTNHAYGIAIDVDPAENTCCGCVKPWNEAPTCKRPAKTEYDRMAMPECWVHAFERYGFYWLGHDVLRDTMHFEFLGVPDKIRRGSGEIAPASTALDGGTHRGGRR
jgi:hypothetical protein